MVALVSAPFAVTSARASSFPVPSAITRTTQVSPAKIVFGTVTKSEVAPGAPACAPPPDGATVTPPKEMLFPALALRVSFPDAAVGVKVARVALPANPAATACGVSVTPTVKVVVVSLMVRPQVSPSRTAPVNSTTSSVNGNALTFPEAAVTSAEMARPDTSALEL